MLVLSVLATMAPIIPSSPLSIWFDRPAEAFTASCPVGNGRLGGMLFGGVERERVVLNENTMWSGRPLDQNRAEAWKARDRINELLMQGKNPEAEQLLNQAFVCDGPGSSYGNGKDGPFGCYQTLGDLDIRFHAQGSASDYRRELDLNQAVARVTFTRGGVRFTRELIASHPGQVLALRLTASKEGALDADLRLTRPERAATRAEGPDLLMEGTLNDGQGGSGLAFGARLRVIAKGGTVETTDSVVRVRNATEALILLGAGTNYEGPIQGNHLGKAFATQVKSHVQAAAQAGWDRLLKTHVADYRRLFARFSLELGPQSDRWRIPTPDRRANPDPSLYALYAQFARYLLIASSREGGLPANLQGLWAEELQTPWNGDYHLNINVQMNYWLAEPLNLAECHRPLFALINALVEPGSRTARAYYNAPGWISHVITNVWGFTAPGENAGWGSTNTSSGWLAQHLWEHYRFRPDPAFLRAAYPTMRGAAECFASMLIAEPKHGWLVTSPSNSPENAFRLPDGRVAHTCMGPTMDIQIVRELFRNTAEAARTLGVDEPLATKLNDLRARLAPHQIGPDGRLQEWLEPYDEPEPQHRHVSHMYGLHPSDQITLRETPDLAAAARKTLEKRGDASTGWSMAWKACFWARLHDADRAEKLEHTDR